MKRILSLVAFFATLQASAQQVNPVPDYVFRNQMSVGRNAVTDTAAYFSIGPRYGATKGFMPPIVGDTATFSSGKRNGLLIFSVQKNKFLYWDSVRVQWSDMAGSSGTYITGSGITGYVPQFNGTTTIDTSALFTLGNRLGVGTSSFAYNSTNTANMELNGTAGGILGFKRNDSARGYLWHTGSDMELANTTAGTLSFNTNSATRGSISSAGVWRLHNLAGTGDRVVQASSNGTLSATTSVTGLVDTLTLSTRAWRQKGLDSLAALEVSGSGTTNYVPKFTAGSTIGNSQIFDNGTNVGIGTASPGSKFHLLSATGTAQTQGDYANNVAIMQGASRTGTTSVGGSFATTLSLQSNDDVITAGSGASIGFAAKWNTGLYSSAAQFGSIFGGKENSTDANLAGYLSFATRPAGGNPTERLRITSGGDVGIGTTSPAHKLDVTGAVRASTDLYLGIASSSTGRAYFFNSANTNRGEIYFDNSNNNFRIESTYGGSGTSQPISFWTGFAERLRIFANGRIGVNTTTDAGYQLDVNGTLRSVNGANFATTSGNVGIGTASPTEKLDVTSTLSRIVVTSTTNSNNAALYFNAKNSGGTNVQGGMYFIPAATPYLSISGDNSGTHLNVTSAGNVGIGTASPGRRLHVQTPDGTASQLQIGQTNQRDYYIGIPASQTYFDFFDASAGASRMRINSDGEILVNPGSDAGDYKLQVSGNALVTAGKLDITTNTAFGLSVSRSGTSVVAGQINNSNGILYYGSESSTGGGLFTGSSAYAAVIGSGAAYPLQFATDNVTRATINTNGELLIATTTDNGDFKLQVNGSALISGSIQTANPVSGTAVPWRLGSVIATNVQLDTANYVEVNINGTFYRLAIVTPL